MHLTSTVQLLPHLAQDEAITSSHTVELSLSCSLHAAKQKMIKSVGGCRIYGLHSLQLQTMYGTHSFCQCPRHGDSPTGVPLVGIWAR